MKAGFDFGAKNIFYAVVEDARIVLEGTCGHRGALMGVYRHIVDVIDRELPEEKISAFGITGNITLQTTDVIDPVIASVEANRFFKTSCSSIISIGCETFYTVMLDKKSNYKSHESNSDCASGTGSFLDQQAKRLGMETQELARKAAAHVGQTPSISTRCAVFAKSDIIHAQARGYATDAIAAGLCKGVARNVLANTTEGKKAEGEILFIGGMSKNKKIVDELSRLTGSKMVAHQYAEGFNAVGAAVLGTQPWPERRRILSAREKYQSFRSRLKIGTGYYPDFSKDITTQFDGLEVSSYAVPETKKVDVFIGIDVGSTSTKAVIVETGGRILSGVYTKTKADPVGAVSSIFETIQKMYQCHELSFKGVGTTGSGRELVKQILSADLSVNEITAHAAGAGFLDPETDTIIEIGGQDSKFTRLSNKDVVHAAMNYVCAAGTGSFIEEQAKRLDIKLTDISDVTLGKRAPLTSDRCTVYMERDLNSFLSQGLKKEQIMAAVLFSVRDNYLAKVMGKTSPGKKIYFQGATARNKALVAVFEEALGRKIHVTRFCHLTGALGCVVKMMELGIEYSSFTGMDLDVETYTEICELCQNQCELRVYDLVTHTIAWGLKCGREYEDKKPGSTIIGSNLEKQFIRHFDTPTVKQPKKKTIGIPLALFMMDYAFLFKGFFQQLGFNVILEKSSDKKLLSGMDLCQSDFCAPMALCHGLAASLVRKGVDFIFLPAMINEQSIFNAHKDEELFRQKVTDAYFCFYSSYAGTIMDNLLKQDFNNKLLQPRIKLNNVTLQAAAEKLGKDLSPLLRVPDDVIANAFIHARQSFMDKKKNWAQIGQQRLAVRAVRGKILLLGRPYVMFDRRLNLGIPRIFEDAGFNIISQNMAAESQFTEPGKDMAAMHWYFGQQFFSALKSLETDPDLYPVFLTCFRCSPDAYLLNYFKSFMERLKRPYLVLQLDEHSSDVGYLTRIQAAMDAFDNDRSRTMKKVGSKTDKKIFKTCGEDNEKRQILKPGDTVLIPMTDQRINAFQKAVFQASGFDAQVLELDRQILSTGYQYASGGECLPNVAIAGSLISMFQSGEIDPGDGVLYLPSICFSCNYNQYAGLVQLACSSAGYPGVRVLNTNGLSNIPDLSARSNILLVSATILGAILNKLYYRFKPYEEKQGTTRDAMNAAQDIVIDHIMNKRSLLGAAKSISKLFAALPQGNRRKPRVAVIGDVYAKFNTVLNDDICDAAQNLGAEILMPSYNELVIHAMMADVQDHGDDPKTLLAMIRYEKQFESVFEPFLDSHAEPDPFECQKLMEKEGFSNFIAGETAISIGRMLYYVQHNIVDAVIHVNPLFCCPGIVSSSLLKKIEDIYGIPVIDLFYDVTNQPNKTIVPHMFYMAQKYKNRSIQHKDKCLQVVNVS